MKDNKTDFKRFAKILNQRFIIASILFLFVLISRQFMIELALILGTLFFEIVFIFAPTQKSLKKFYEEVNKGNENMKKLFAAIRGALFIVEDQNFKIMMINKDAEHYIFKDIENVEGVNFIDAIEWDLVEENHIIELINQKEEVNNIELEIKDQEDRSVTVLLSSMKGHYNNRDAILISLYDITLQKQAEDAMRKLAIEDKLTGLYNRHFMDTIISSEIDRSDRYNYPVSIFILDLDHFKLVNDNFGHPIGDSVLKETADIASKNTRKSDFLIRLGGEEFLLFMPHTNLQGAIDVAEKTRNEIENYSYPVAGKITASFGVAEREKNQSFQSLYEEADIALYHAKEEGRNRVISFTGPVVEPSTIIYLEWKAEWNSSNQMIDRQHKELLDVANDIIIMSLSNTNKNEAEQKVDTLIQNIIKHFDYEESVLKSIEFPDYLKHVAIHKILEKKVGELKASYLKDEIKLSAFFTFIVDDVLVGHLLDVDTRYFSYITKKEEK
ncbi:MAG: diguanylate cyclase [Mobilitalea sp.]